MKKYNIIFFAVIMLFSTAMSVEDELANQNEKFKFIDDIYSESWALIIGINKYQNVDPLSFAVNDAVAVNDILVNKYGFDNENIKLITDEMATKDNIMEGFQDILLSAGEKDRIVVFYAGHGDTYPLPNGGDMGYIIPVDGQATKDKIFLTSIAMSTIEQLADMSAAKHILYLVDACYGGLTLNTRGLGKEQTPAYLKKMTREKGRQVITAGGKDEEVMEKAEWGHSAFTKNLLQGLENELADSNNDGIISGEELGGFIRGGVVIDTDGQHTPQKGRLGSDLGEFVFISETLEDDVDALDGGMGDIKDQLAMQQEQMQQLTNLLLAQAQGADEINPTGSPKRSKKSKVKKSKNSINMKTASTLSFVFPGMGHYYSGRTGKGVLFAGLELAALAGMAAMSSSYATEADNYNAVYTHWEENKHNPNASQISNQQAVTDAFSAKNSAMVGLIGVGSFSAGVWIWNIIDMKKTKNYSSHDPVSFGVNSRGQVEARINF